MQLRQIENDSLISVVSEDVATDALVTNNPHLIDPNITMGRIVVMPERALVNLVAKPESASRQQLYVIDSLASKLLEEVRTECGEGCEATTDTFKGDVPEIGMIVVSAGVICENANNCESCPMGVREVL